MKTKSIKPGYRASTLKLRAIQRWLPTTTNLNKTKPVTESYLNHRARHTHQGLNSHSVLVPLPLTASVTACVCVCVCVCKMYVCVCGVSDRKSTRLHSS